MAGRQCLKRLYLECFERKLADPIPPDRQAIFDAGTRIGALARDRYPDGRLVAEGYLHHDRARRATEHALGDPNLPALYEAAFTFEKIRIRADVLRRTGAETYDLIEVKSGTKVKPEHHDDVALQLYVLRGRGLKVERAGLLHLNREYEYRGGDYDLDQLFALSDLTGEAEGLQEEVGRQLGGMWETLAAPAPPAVATGPHCEKPYVCPFYGHCHADEDPAAHPVEELYLARAPLLARLRKEGCDEIQGIPAGFEGLSRIQARQREAVLRQREVIDRSALRRKLGKLRHPIHFIDFETFNPAQPLSPGPHPSDDSPFQWSDHILSAGKTVSHHEFLHEGPDDPRPAFARSLLEAAKDAGTVVTYSAFEKTRLGELACALPALAPALGALEARIVDLLPIVRKNTYHPEFHGSFSLKSVLPALVPGAGYGGLEISEGGQASLAYAEMISDATPPKKARALRAQLLAYCERDTEAMLKLYEKLRK
ncbi:MAG: DUF2779 domain-containing protein [Myxococcota bacterium]